MLFTSDALALRNNKHLIQVPYGSISCVYILDRMKEERAKKVFMLLQFEDNFSVTHGKKTLQNITIETKDSLELDAKFPETPANGEQPRVFKVLLPLAGTRAAVLGVPVCRPSACILQQCFRNCQKLAAWHWQTHVCK